MFLMGTTSPQITTQRLVINCVSSALAQACITCSGNFNQSIFLLVYILPYGFYLSPNLCFQLALHLHCPVCLYYLPLSARMFCLSLLPSYWPCSFLLYQSQQCHFTVYKYLTTMHQQEKLTFPLLLICPIQSSNMQQQCFFSAEYKLCGGKSKTEKHFHLVLFPAQIFSCNKMETIV